MYEKDIAMIKVLQAGFAGEVTEQGRVVDAQLEPMANYYRIRVAERDDHVREERSLEFTGQGLNLNLSCLMTGRHNSINVKHKSACFFTVGDVYYFESASWKEKPAYYRGYFGNVSDRFIYDLTGNAMSATLLINNVEILVSREDGFLVVENVVPLDTELYYSIVYNALVAIGFISGRFMQDEEYVFQRLVREQLDADGYCFRSLRPGGASIYHAVTGNPFAYEHMIGRQLADQLYKTETLSDLGERIISCLAELSMNFSQIQYAFVLFIEANANGPSLLVKNNCFFAVLEVLKKYFYDVFKDMFGSDYSRKGNVEKFRLIFECLFPVSDDEIRTIEKRNVFMHGDIKDIKDEEMNSLMEKQITLIYRSMLTHAGFEGYIIDHYAIRNGQPEKAFIKINPGRIGAGTL